MMNVLAQITQWNFNRNNLEFDPALEIKLLSEEAREFMEASTKADRLREAADFMFVLTGTFAKYASTIYPSVHAWERGVEGFEKMQAWISSIQQMIETSLEVDETIQLLPQALQIVAQANEAKGSVKNADGKVVKGDAYCDPIATIKGLILVDDELNGPLWN